MTVAEADHILGMTPDRLNDFITENLRAKKLSALVRGLNDALACDDPYIQSRARAVLQRIGLLDID